MALNRLNTRSFHRKLYGGHNPGWLSTITLTKRNSDQSAGTTTAYTLNWCLLPGNRIEGRISSASKSFYSGEAVELVSRFGTELRATINHPILTPRGFVPAGKLKPGDYLVCDFGDVEDLPVHVENGPALVENVFESFSELPHNLSTSKAIPFDFHGDGVSVKGNINIVTPYWELLGNGDFHTSKGGGDFVFDGLNPLPANVDRVGRCRRFLERSNSSTKSLVRYSDLSFPLFRRHPAPLENFVFAVSPHLDIVFPKQFAQGGSVGLIDGSQGRNGFSSTVTPDDFRQGVPDFPRSGYTCFGISSRFDTGLAKPYVEAMSSDTDLWSELSGGFPGEVSLDKLIEIRRFHYDGPVYDFESPVNYFTTSCKGRKAFVSNCRRKKVYHQGNPLLTAVASQDYCVFQIPKESLDEAGVDPGLINPLDRITDEDGYVWQPESDNQITLQLGFNFLNLVCKRLPNASA